MTEIKKIYENKGMYETINIMTSEELKKCFNTSDILEILCSPYDIVKEMFDNYLNTIQ